MVFVDEHQRSIACISSFSDIMGFIASLQRMAAEMARRRALLVKDDGSAEQPALDTISGTLNIASADFRMTDDGYIVGSMVGEGGQVVGIRMQPDVANEMTRNMLRSAPVASTC